MDPDADPGGPKTFGSYRSGSGSATMPKTRMYTYVDWYVLVWTFFVTAGVLQRLIWFPFSELVVLTHTSLLDRYWNLAFFFHLCVIGSVPDPWCLVRIQIPDPYQWFCIRLRIRILLFCSVDFKMPTEISFFIKLFCLPINLLYPQSIYISLQRLQVINKSQLRVFLNLFCLVMDRARILEAKKSFGSGSRPWL